MKLYVTVELFKSVLCDVKVFKTLDEASEEEKAWLKQNDILDEASRDAKAGTGTEFVVWGLEQHEEQDQEKKAEQLDEPEDKTVDNMRHTMLKIARKLLMCRAAIDGDAYYDSESDEDGYVISILIAMRHWCDRYGMDWKEQVELAERYFLDDMGEENKPSESEMGL